MTQKTAKTVLTITSIVFFALVAWEVLNALRLASASRPETFLAAVCFGLYFASGVQGFLLLHGALKPRSIFWLYILTLAASALGLFFGTTLTSLVGVALVVISLVALRQYQKR